MSWFNLKWRKEDIELLRAWRNNVGKNFRFIDEMKPDPDADDEPAMIPLVIETNRPINFRPRSAKRRIYRIAITAQERKDIFSIKGRVCNRCGHRRTLEIHHIDEDPSNNVLANLEILCHECHISLRHVQKG